MGKGIHWEMCKKFKFNRTYKWYMHNPGAVLENDTHQFLWDFDIETDPIISARRPDLIIMNKKKRTCKSVDFAVPADHRLKRKKMLKEGHVPRHWLGTEKTEEHESDNNTNRNWCFWYSYQRIIKETRGLGNKKPIGDYIIWTARILRRVLETWGHLQSLHL